MKNDEIKKKMRIHNITPFDIADRLRVNVSTIYRRLSGAKKQWGWRSPEIEILEKMFEEKEREEE